MATSESLDQGFDCDHRLLDGGRDLGGLVAERPHLGHVLGHAGQVGRTEDVICLQNLEQESENLVFDILSMLKVSLIMSYS